MIDTMTDDAQAFIDSIDPATMRDGKYLRQITHALNNRDAAETELVDAIRAARQAGDSWTMIGLMLHTSKQNAHRKYAKLVGE